MMQKITYYTIATGGAYKEPLIKTLVITDEDEMFLEEEFSSFEEYVAYVLEEYQAEVEQGFGKLSALTEDEVRLLTFELPS